jgi:hypothetical protein
MHVCMHVCMYIWIYISTYKILIQNLNYQKENDWGIGAYSNVHTHTHTHIHTCIHARAHTHTYTHTSLTDVRSNLSEINRARHWGVKKSIAIRYSEVKAQNTAVNIVYWWWVKAPDIKPARLNIRYWRVQLKKISEKTLASGTGTWNNYKSMTTPSKFGGLLTEGLRRTTNMTKSIKCVWCCAKSTAATCSRCTSPAPRPIASRSVSVCLRIGVLCVCVSVSRYVTRTKACHRSN